MACRVWSVSSSILDSWLVCKLIAIPHPIDAVLKMFFVVKSRFNKELRSYFYGSYAALL